MKITIVVFAQILNDLVLNACYPNWLTRFIPYKPREMIKMPKKIPWKPNPNIVMVIRKSENYSMTHKEREQFLKRGENLVAKEKSS